MPKYTTIFFDLFNTLISVAEVPESIGRFTADILGFDHDQWNTVCFSAEHEICQPTLHEDVIHCLAKSIDPRVSLARVKEATEHRQRRFDYALLQVRDDVLEVLEQLKLQGIALGLISNASTAEVAAWSDSPLVEFIDQAFFSCECGFKKPEREIYHHAINKMSARKNQSLFIGDGGSKELIGAHEAGLTTVLTTQFSKPHRVEKVRQQQAVAIHHEVEHVRDVLELLESTESIR
jgi:putative hydrolase of the HAD superfamily